MVVALGPKQRPHEYQKNFGTFLLIFGFIKKEKNPVSHEVLVPKRGLEPLQPQGHTTLNRARPKIFKYRVPDVFLSSRHRHPAYDY